MAFTPLNALSAFIVVARRLSYAAAARDLGVSTSALSQSVRQLEERLEVTLLTRTSRSVALTEAGHRLLDNAGPAIDQALESMKTVRAKRGEVTGRVRLTVPSASISLVLADLLPRFFARYPAVSVEVQVDDRFVNTVASRHDARQAVTLAGWAQKICRWHWWQPSLGSASSWSSQFSCASWMMPSPQRGASVQVGVQVS